MTYYEQHKDINSILIDNIQKLSTDKNEKTLRLEYKDNKRLRIKIVDMPDANAKQHIIDKMNEANMFINASRSNYFMEQSKFYRLNLYLGISGIFISLLLFFMSLNKSTVLLLVTLFSLFICAIIVIYSFYKSAKLKDKK